MNANDSTDAPLPPRRWPWPAFFAVLLAVVNGFALAILYADTTLRIDGKPSAEGTRSAFISISELNIFLAGLVLASIFLGRRGTERTPTGGAVRASPGLCLPANAAGRTRLRLASQGWPSGCRLAAGDRVSRDNASRGVVKWTPTTSATTRPKRSAGDSPQPQLLLPAPHADGTQVIPARRPALPAGGQGVLCGTASRRSRPLPLVWLGRRYAADLPGAAYDAGRMP